MSRSCIELSSLIAMKLRRVKQINIYTLNKILIQNSQSKMTSGSEYPPFRGAGAAASVARSATQGKCYRSIILKNEKAFAFGYSP